MIDLHGARRVAPPFAAPEGYRWVASVDGEWSTSPIMVDGWQCLNRDHGERCPNGAVAVLYRGLYRGRRPRPYRYCALHLYGRWIDGANVMGWILEMVPA